MITLEQVGHQDVNFRLYSGGWVREDILIQGWSKKPIAVQMWQNFMKVKVLSELAVKLANDSITNLLGAISNHTMI